MRDHFLTTEFQRPPLRCQVIIKEHPTTLSAFSSLSLAFSSPVYCHVWLTHLPTNTRILHAFSAAHYALGAVSARPRSANLFLSGLRSPELGKTPMGEIRPVQKLLLASAGSAGRLTPAASRFGGPFPNIKTASLT